MNISYLIDFKDGNIVLRQFFEHKGSIGNIQDVVSLSSEAKLSQILKSCGFTTVRDWLPAGYNLVLFNRLMHYSKCLALHNLDPSIVEDAQTKLNKLSVETTGNTDLAEYLRRFFIGENEYLSKEELSLNVTSIQLSYNEICEFHAEMQSFIENV